MALAVPCCFKSSLINHFIFEIQMNDTDACTERLRCFAFKELSAALELL
jgi:hypothetical protein